jgi:hypothetical protein
LSSWGASRSSFGRESDWELKRRIGLFGFTLVAQLAAGESLPFFILFGGPSGAFLREVPSIALVLSIDKGRFEFQVEYSVQFTLFKQVGRRGKDRSSGTVRARSYFGHYGKPVYRKILHGELAVARMAPQHKCPSAPIVGHSQKPPLFKVRILNIPDTPPFYVDSIGFHEKMKNLRLPFMRPLAA